MTDPNEMLRQMFSPESIYGYFITAGKMLWRELALPLLVRYQAQIIAFLVGAFILGIITFVATHFTRWICAVEGCSKCETNARVRRVKSAIELLDWLRGLPGYFKH